jgi:hypothetical protein
MRTDDRLVRKAPPNLASLIRGLYRRVAHQLELDPSYISRVARGERQSKIVESALRRELRKILGQIGKKRPGRDHGIAVKRAAAKK